METTEKKAYCIRAINKRGQVVGSTVLNASEQDMGMICLGISFTNSYVVAYNVNEYGHADKIAKSIGTCPQSYDHRTFMKSFYTELQTNK